MAPRYGVDTVATLDRVPRDGLRQRRAGDGRRWRAARLPGCRVHRKRGRAHTAAGATSSRSGLGARAIRKGRHAQGAGRVVACQLRPREAARLRAGGQRCRVFRGESRQQAGPALARRGAAQRGARGEGRGARLGRQHTHRRLSASLRHAATLRQACCRNRALWRLANQSERAPTSRICIGKRI